MMSSSPSVIIVGAGAAGLMAAQFLPPASYVILEAGSTAGQKILASGGGRCNIAPTTLSVADYQGRHPQIIKQVQAACPLEELRAWWQTYGVNWVAEGDRYYPDTQRAQTVLAALLRSTRPQIIYQAVVSDFWRDGNHWCVESSQGTYRAPQLVLATGGGAAPQLGGRTTLLSLLTQRGVPVVTPQPALVSLICPQAWWTDLAGIALPLRIYQGRQAFTGEVLLTHTGLSGPLILDHGWRWSGELRLDWVPAYSREELEQALLAGPETLLTLLKKYVPERLGRRWLERAAIAGTARGAHLPKEERRRLLDMIKNDVWGSYHSAGWATAQAMAGGVDVAAVIPQTMELKNYPQLYLAGEILDMVGRCGGFNLYWAWATGWLVGHHLAKLASPIQSD